MEFTSRQMEHMKKIPFLGSHRKVVLHPIVMLSVVDHYNRCAQGTSRRVVGTILGEVIDGDIHITNSFAVPFEEDAKNPLVWFFDHNYHEHMFTMFKKINTKEKVLGWYSTGPKCKPADLEIHELYRKYCPNPIYVIVDITQKEELPIEAYISVEEPTSDRRFRRTFAHVPSEMGAFEAEEVGLEHLLRDLTNVTTSTLSKKVESKISALKSMTTNLAEITDYIKGVISGVYTVNPAIIYMLQNILNLFPSTDTDEIVEAFTINMNDTALAMYLGSIIRAMLALHNLIDNMAENKRIAGEKSKTST
ncbi:26S proteasome regulatory particle non-ATPase subunit8, putative [Babesia bigemina]|uniref:26S proteasome regulatory particle non-ATPase subunit8, putative n=1 Tax=Babesia bigemina TaxID=5866 RepID=A0A061D588_BABBI|nr:26S proteasome regulatory particle non-ATPase subunit8, putative [Babesia bigemina]CDR95207.1 26S proteasome regulatory particle non-ATPase subunit8, putative [Babesia bigemina]|eukprot:XP_012767393.1 26S proteasome regulatory particle non-ATPase subunit8, putative [Babesia bigemina]